MAMDPSEFAGLVGNADAGETVFHAGGCASCHAEVGAEGEARLILAGGQSIRSEFGTFAVPNISSDPVNGIGSWTLDEFANALLRGVSPSGQHYYPVFPYTSYSKMTLQDVADLKVYLDTLPESSRPNDPHDLAFPYTVRRGLGLWKRRYMSPAWVAAAPSDTLERGRYLVEALSHCAECHTPRDQFGGLDLSQWMAGAPNPRARGDVPNITPAELDWTVEETAYYLESGFDPSFEPAGGSMADVVNSLAQLSSDDRLAIAAYVKGLAPIPSRQAP